MLANTINRRSISIHAPTNGATSSPHSPVIIACHFNPRSDERSDSKWLFDFDEDNEISIHAPTNGATRSRTQRQTRPIYFNPRSDERSDVDAIPCHDVISVFQSTLRRTERHFQEMVSGTF